VSALLRKRAYPYPVSSIELIQTHISYVFLAGDQVYKLKKPVDLGFLDFSTLEKRRQACEAEVRLNRRGCPGGVYIGVEPLKRYDGAFRIGGEGETVDYLVHMKRLPRERMMDRMLERGEADFDVIGRVAARLAELHRSAERDERIGELGGFGQQVRNWRENLMQLHPLVGRTLGGPRLERIERFVDRFMHAEADLLRRRERDGWIRDCHGDLRSDAVCFDPSVPGGICMFDCIEFNEIFRYSDTGLDAAFLAMDLEYRGHADLSDLFISLYAHAAGDKELPVLLPLFKCHRATVRGKVESLQLLDPSIGARQKAAARRRARKYFALADSYTRRRDRQALILVTGPSGSGKSVLAGVLAAHLSAVLLSTDTVRRELFREHGRGAPVDTGIYSPEAREGVYHELRRQAEEMLVQGRSIVLDGSYIERKQRLPIERLAGQLRARLLIVECSAPPAVVRERQRRRESEAWTASEGRWEVYLAQKARLEPVTEVPDSRRIAMDTTLPIAEQIEAVGAKLKGR
jgi:aminoglycoside phosphotransferase family enzyme/predicted kinase